MSQQHGDPNRNYGQEWKSWREQRGWSQETLAEVLNVCEKTVRNVEHGTHRPSSVTRLKMMQLQKRYQEA